MGRFFALLLPYIYTTLVSYSHIVLLKRNLPILPTGSRIRMIPPIMAPGFLPKTFPRSSHGLPNLPTQADTATNGNARTPFDVTICTFRDSSSY